MRLSRLTGLLGTKVSPTYTSDSVESHRTSHRGGSNPIQGSYDKVDLVHDHEDEVDLVHRSEDEVDLVLGHEEEVS